jgi:hypothetical protein
MNRFPSYLEHRGVYNVNPEDYREDLAPEDDPTPYFRSVEHLPPLTGKEFQNICSATYRALERYGRLPGMSAADAKHFYRYCAGDEISDRTVRVELPDFRALSPEFVEGLQRDVLAERRLWRIFIVAESPETVVIIYPDAVRVGTVPPGGDWKTTLPQTISEVLQIREAREGPQRRQLEYLKQKVPKELTKVRTEPFRLVAAFDTYYIGDPTRISVWFLYAAEKHWFDISVEEPENAASGAEVALKPDGSFDDNYRFDPNVQPAFWLKQSILPAGFKGKLRLARTRPGPVVDARWTVDFDPSSVIKDADLKAHGPRAVP